MVKHVYYLLHHQWQSGLVACNPDQNLSVIHNGTQRNIDIIFIYGKSLREAFRMYKDIFPNHNCLLRNTYAKEIKNFRQTSELFAKKRV